MTLILLVIAFVCFLLSALNVDAKGVNLVSIGLACWVLTVLLPFVR
jgi:hypothetical protein